MGHIVIHKAAKIQGVIVDDVLKIFDDDDSREATHIDGRAVCAVAYKKLNP